MPFSGKLECIFSCLHQPDLTGIFGRLVCLFCLPLNKRVNNLSSPEVHTARCMRNSTGEDAGGIHRLSKTQNQTIYENVDKILRNKFSFNSKYLGLQLTCNQGG